MSGPARSTREQALIRLSVREYAAGEMKSYLKRKGYPTAEIVETVEALISQGLISDERYSKIIARESSARSKGPAYIRMKLWQKGVQISSEKARSLFMESSQESELELAKRLLRARYPRARDTAKDRRRAFQGLIRRGISPEIVRRCLDLDPEELGEEN